MSAERFAVAGGRFAVCLVGVRHSGRELGDKSSGGCWGRSAPAIVLVVRCRRSSGLRPGAPSTYPSPSVVSLQGSVCSRALLQLLTYGCRLMAVLGLVVHLVGADSWCGVACGFHACVAHVRGAR